MTDLFTSSALAIANANPDSFTPEFLAYLPENLHVYERFEREALKVAAKGFKHYSARTIIEVLRHWSALEEKGGAWKLNNDQTPYHARLFALCNPLYATLFEFREAKAAKRAQEAAA